MLSVLFAIMDNRGVLVLLTPLNVTARSAVKARVFDEKKSKISSLNMICLCLRMSCPKIISLAMVCLSVLQMCYGTIDTFGLDL